MTKLSAPTNLAWSGTNATFDKLAVETNVTNYYITITGSGTVSDNTVTKTGSNLSVAVDGVAVGDTFKVRAIALETGLFLDSDDSAASGGYALPKTSPAFVTHPSDQSVTEGGNVDFTVSADGNPAPGYQWEVSTDNGSTWNAISDGGVYSGATTATLTLTNIPLGMNGYQYRCTAANSEGTIDSSVATLTVDAQPALTYTVTFKDWNGTTLSTQAVEHGKSAIAPPNPTSL